MTDPTSPTPDEQARRLARWVIDLMFDVGEAGFGCFTGDCPHTTREMCVESLMQQPILEDEYRAARAEEKNDA